MDILLFLCGMQIVPFIIALIINEDAISYGGKRNIYKWLVQLFCAFMNLITVLILYAFRFGKSYFSVLSLISDNQIAYQDIFSMIIILLLSTVLSIVYPITVQFLLRKYTETIELDTYSKSGLSKVFLCLIIEAIPLLLAASIAQSGWSYIKLDEVCRRTENDESYIIICNEGELPQKINTLLIYTDDECADALTYENVIIPGKGTVTFNMPYDEGLEIKKKGGSEIFISDGKGLLLDSVEVVKLEKNETYKRNQKIDDQWDVVALETQVIVEEKISVPKLSHESGFYDNTFELVMETEDTAAIYYTTDGSIPTIDSLKYNGPITVYNKSNEPNVYREIKNVIPDYINDWVEPENVDKAFILRAIAVDSNGEASDVVNATYFVGLDKYKDKKVISLVADPDDLFGPDGIYVTGENYNNIYSLFENEADREAYVKKAKYEKAFNYSLDGLESERAANITFFENGVHFSQNIGIRIQGNSTRNNQLKRFSLYARKEYSDSKFFGYYFYGDGISDHSLVLREGLLNAISLGLLKDRDVASANVIPVEVFLDGEFWYSTYLQEKYSESYFANHYNVSEDNVVITKDRMYEELKGLFDKYDISKEEDYNEFLRKVDVQSYIDCYAFNMYMGNTDLKDSKNVFMWRTKDIEDEKYGDGRWRWALHDLDLGFQGKSYHANLETDAAFNTFSMVSESNTHMAFNQSLVFQTLKTSPIFCKDYVTTFMDLSNSYLSEKNIGKELEKYGKDITFDDYYFRDRGMYIVPYMAEEFNLQGTLEKVTLKNDNIEYGNIKINTIIPDMEENKWSGDYYTDYPITVTAIEKDGHNFVEWQITKGGNTVSYQDKTIEVKLEEGGVEINAIFK